jgi:hypothetical protein
MGNKKKTKVEETTIEQAETHRVRSMMIVLIVIAATIGLWYLVSERD